MSLVFNRLRFPFAGEVGTNFLSRLCCLWSLSFLRNCFLKDVSLMDSLYDSAGYPLPPEFFSENSFVYSSCLEYPSIQLGRFSNDRAFVDVKEF